MLTTQYAGGLRGRSKQGPDLHRWLRLIDPRYLGRRLTATMTGGPLKHFY
jgi:hypothetical protein